MPPPKETYENHLHETEPRWFAVYTRYKREKLVAQQLRDKGIEVYLPLQHFTRRYTRKIKKVEMPLISCYVFARITKKEYVPVLETPDVVQFVRFAKGGTRPVRRRAAGRDRIRQPDRAEGQIDRQREQEFSDRTGESELCAPYLCRPEFVASDINRFFGLVVLWSCGTTCRSKDRDTGITSSFMMRFLQGWFFHFVIVRLRLISGEALFNIHFV